MTDPGTGPRYALYYAPRADEGLATAIFLSMTLHRPLLLEGEAGVGKTEAAKSLAVATGARLIRLQCYEGLDVAHAVYEWNYPRQLLHIRLQESTDLPLEVKEREIFSEPFLLKRPLLQAITHPKAPVLLIQAWPFVARPSMLPTAVWMLAASVPMASRANSHSLPRSTLSPLVRPL